MEELKYPHGWIRGVGPSDAKFAVVGEHPTSEDIKHFKPFFGPAGQELDRMLNQAGLLRTEAWLTHVIGTMPPRGDLEKYYQPNPKSSPKEYILTPEAELGLKLLWRELENVKPTVIITCGNAPTFAVTGKYGITKYRGSAFIINPPWGGECVVVPTHSPSGVLRQWSVRTATVTDLRRAARYTENPESAKKPDFNYILRPTFEQAMDILSSLEKKSTISCDIETRMRHIACCGFGWSGTEAICIPFLKLSNDSSRTFDSYWAEEEEVEIVKQIQRNFQKDSEFIFQNGSYDMQYFARHWGIIPRTYHDTMIGHHVNWCELPKGLDYLSSIYCDWHQYWKDDGKEWNPRLHNDEQLWEYNCDDCRVTFECWDHIKSDITRYGTQEQYDFQIRRLHNTFMAMLRGTNIDRQMKAELSGELYEYIMALRASIFELTGQELNPKSPKQMKEYFYGELGLPNQYVYRKGKRSLTLNENALINLANKEPLVKRLVKVILDERSAGVFRSTFLEMKIDHDGRARCSYNVAGTVTFRLSSSSDAFDYGTNLQNIPKGDGDKWEKTYDYEIPLPNVKKLFRPDPGRTFFEIDLDRADLQVVVWEAEDDDLKRMLREGVDIHLANAADVFHLPYTVEDLLDPEILPRIAERYAKQRQFAKAFVHGTNYGGKASTMAKAVKCSVGEAESAQKRWFHAHPGIREWHRRIEEQLYQTRQVRNAFGYRRHFFDRIEGLLPEALAWIPQSTVGLVIDKFWDNLERNLPEVDVLLQVHDSLAGQYPTYREKTLLPLIHEQGQIAIPYDDPLIIPIGIETSTINWGEVKAREWPEKWNG